MPLARRPGPRRSRGCRGPNTRSAALDRLYALGLDAFRVAAGVRRRRRPSGSSSTARPATSTLSTRRQFAREGALATLPRAGAIVPLDAAALSRDRRGDGRRAAEALAAATSRATGSRSSSATSAARRGEIDLVARDGDTLVFVEVRLRRAGATSAAPPRASRRPSARGSSRPRELYLAAAAAHAAVPLRRRAARRARPGAHRVAARRVRRLARATGSSAAASVGSCVQSAARPHACDPRHGSDPASARISPTAPQLKLDAAGRARAAIARAAERHDQCLLADGKILACGNGGSAADAQHFAAEMVGRFERERPELPAISLTTDTSILTADRQRLFVRAGVREAGARARRARATCCSRSRRRATRPTSIAAIDAAHEREMRVVALTGKGGGRIGELLRRRRRPPVRPARRGPRASRKSTCSMIHCLCDAIDDTLLGDEAMTRRTLRVALVIARPPCSRSPRCPAACPLVVGRRRPAPRWSPPTAARPARSSTTRRSSSRSSTDGGSRLRRPRPPQRDELQRHRAADRRGARRGRRQRRIGEARARHRARARRAERDGRRRRRRPLRAHQRHVHHVEGQDALRRGETSSRRRTSRSSPSAASST